MSCVITIDKSQAVATGPTDICKVPAPPASPIPTPLPNIAMAATAMPTTITVFVCGVPALTKASECKISSGDEVGLAGGVMSGKNMGPAKAVIASVITKFNGNYVVYVGCGATINGTNTVGAFTPGQATVMVGG